MLRWISSGLIVALGLGVAVLKYPPFTQDPIYLWSRMAGYAVSPLIFGAVAAWIFGLVRKGSEGAFHRRLNWIALLLFVLSTLGWLAEVGRKLQ